MSTSLNLEMTWRLTGPGSATLTVVVGTEAVELHTTYVGDGLGSVLQAAIDLRLGARSTIALLPDEPGGTYLFFGGANDDVYLQIVIFPNAQLVESRWTGGQILWHGRVDVQQFLRQTLVMADNLLERIGGPDSYATAWGGIRFPADLLARLRDLG